MTKTSNIQQFDTQQEQQLWQLFRITRQQAYRAKLIDLYKGLIGKYLNSYLKRRQLSFLQDAERNELASEAMLALISGVDSFKPDIGVKFEVYIRTRLNGCFIDWIRKSDYFPRVVAKSRASIDLLRNRFKSLFGRSPSDQELIDKFGEEANALLSDILVNSSVKNMSSMNGSGDSIDSDDPCLTLSSTGMREEAKQYRKIEITKAVSEILQNKRQSMIVVLYYVNGWNNNKIAKLLECSISSVVDHRNEALRVLRQHKDILASDLGLEHLLEEK